MMIQRSIISLTKFELSTYRADKKLDSLPILVGQIFQIRRFETLG